MTSFQGPEHRGVVRVRWIPVLIAGMLATAVLGGCASRPINVPIERVDPQSGYRPYLLIPKLQNNDPHTLFVLSLSGGGTRAAALSYGLLEELRRTEFVVDGRRRRLIDEVDLMTGVSGDSFTALSYALYGAVTEPAAMRRVLGALGLAAQPPPGRAVPAA